MNKFPIIIITTVTLFFFQGLFSQPPKYDGKIIRQIDFVGLRNTDPEDLLYIMKSTINYPLKSSEIASDIKEIYKKAKLESVVVEVEEYQDGIRLRFVCKERPIVKTIQFKGHDEVTENDLTSAIPLKEGEVFRKDYLEKSLKKIKDKYDSEGLFNAVISYKVTQLKDEENSVKVQFIIDEGEEIKVKKISILGAKKIYPKELTGVMETSEKGLFKDGAFKHDVFEQDKSKILALYKENGYLDAQIVEDKVEYEWINPEKKDERCIFITIKATEGEKYYFDSYSVKINAPEEKMVFKPAELMKDFELNTRGEVFNNTLFEKDRQSISFNYASKGYIFARVIPEKTVTEVEVDVDGRKEIRKYVKVDITIDEGTQAYIDMIIIKGNKKTKDKVIRRELVFKEGELFDSKKMQVSRELVYNLGYFKQVNIDVRPGSREGYMNLVVDVEEQPSGTISLGGGYGTKSGFSIFADVGENNLLGNGQRVGVRFEYGPERMSVALSFGERWLFDYPLGLQTSIFYSLYKVKDNPSIFPTSSEKAEYNKQSIGYTMTLSYRFWYYYSIGTGWSHEFKRIIEPSGNSSEEIFQQMNLKWQQARTLSYFVTRDSRDNYLNPTAGWKSEFVVSFTGGPVIGGDDHYVKLDPGIFVYYSPFHLPFLKTHPCVFEFRGSGSFIVPPVGKKSMGNSYIRNPWVKYEDRMRLGGPETLRGWNYDDEKFPASWKDIGLFHRILYGAEFRVPIHPQLLWTALFFDAGSLWGDKFWEKQIVVRDLYYNRTNLLNYSIFSSFLQLYSNTQSSKTETSVVFEDILYKRLYNIDKFFKVNQLRYFKYSYGFGFRIQIPMMPLRFWFGKKLIYNGKFKSLGGLNFQFGIGDIRF
ncbi:MAG: outer membrane protein assembly factor BamA [Spirochaetes bacterium]|jgi:outer membrane protein insertion porin family|nr:outer membrane protein assembly factor BamA [Spirochaetota bacterium]